MKTFLIITTIACSLFLTNSISYSQYNSDFEENTFMLFEENKVSDYDLFHAINYNEVLYSSGKQKINKHISDLKAKNLSSKALKKTNTSHL